MTPLRRARKAREMTIYDLAKAAGVRPGTVSKAERGRCSPEMAARLVGAIGGDLTEEMVLYPERFDESTRGAGQHGEGLGRL